MLGVILVLLLAIALPPTNGTLQCIPPGLLTLTRGFGFPVYREPFYILRPVPKDGLPKPTLYNNIMHYHMIDITLNLLPD